MKLLDRFTPAGAEFIPATTMELFVLRLAQKLGDVPGLKHYLALADTHADWQLLRAYRRTLRGSGQGNHWRQFHHELERLHGSSNYEHQSNLISIRVERRAVAAAVFHGQHLEYTDARQLSSAPNKALDSAVSFVTWILDRFAVESAALELIPEDQEIQRRVLHAAICEVVRQRLLPIWEVPRVALLEGCGSPALRSRAQLRKITTAIWPVLEGPRAKIFVQDAAVLGLHIQTERLFIIN